MKKEKSLQPEPEAFSTTLPETVRQLNLYLGRSHSPQNGIRSTARRPLSPISRERALD
jgi:hypothetical protein